MRGMGLIAPAGDVRFAEIGTANGKRKVRQRTRLIPRRAQATTDRRFFGWEKRGNSTANVKRGKKKAKKALRKRPLARGGAREHREHAQRGARLREAGYQKRAGGILRDIQN